MAPARSDAIIRVRDITVQFGTTRVLDGLNLDVKRGEILGFVGPSGAGQSVLTRTIIGLVPKIAGRIDVFGIDLDAANAVERRGVERRWGILFQQGALFSSLSVRQNMMLNTRFQFLVLYTVGREALVALLPTHRLEDGQPHPGRDCGVERADLARGVGQEKGSPSWFVVHSRASTLRSPHPLAD